MIKKLHLIVVILIANVSWLVAGASALSYDVNVFNNRGGDWVDMRYGATRLDPGDDANQTGIPLGFSFPFYERSFDRVNISPNGWVSFTSRSTQYTANDRLPSSRMPENLIAPFFIDLDFRRSGSLYYRQESGRFVVSWINAQEFSRTGGPFSFQLHLYRNGTIVFLYRNIAYSAARRQTTIGIQRSSRNGITLYRGYTTGSGAPRSGDMAVLTPEGVAPPAQVIRAPDLVIERVELIPPRPAPGQLIRARVTVRNRGTAPSGGGRLELWANRSTATAIGETGDGAATIGRLEPGRWRVLEFTLRQNVRAPDQGGSYMCRVVVDNGNVIREADETNNSRSIPYQVVRQNISPNDNDQVVSALRGGVRYFSIQIPRRQSRFIARTSEGFGDPDLYVKRGSQPTRRDFTWASRNPGTSERIIVNRPAAGTYFITLDAKSDFSLVKFRATYYRNVSRWFSFGDTASLLADIVDGSASAQVGYSVGELTRIGFDTPAYGILADRVHAIERAGHIAQAAGFVLQVVSMAVNFMDTAAAQNELQYSVEFNDFVKHRVEWAAGLAGAKGGALAGIKVGVWVKGVGAFVGAPIGAIAGGFGGKELAGEAYDLFLEDIVMDFAEVVWRDPGDY